MICISHRIFHISRINKQYFVFKVYVDCKTYLIKIKLKWKPESIDATVALYYTSFHCAEANFKAISTHVQTSNIWSPWKFSKIKYVSCDNFCDVMPKKANTPLIPNFLYKKYLFRGHRSWVHTDLKIKYKRQVISATRNRFQYWDIAWLTSWVEVVWKLSIWDRHLLYLFYLNQGL